MNLPDHAPAWLQLAWREIGNREVPDNRGPAVQRYIELSHCGEQGDPWCAIFANAMLEESGLHGTRSPSSQSFRHDANFVALTGPALGAIVVFWRTSKSSGLGHVGFYVGERDGYVYTLGGNEGDMVQVEFLAKAASTFGLVGYYWPATVPKPAIGAIAISAAIPAHQVSVTDEPPAKLPSKPAAPIVTAPPAAAIAPHPIGASQADYDAVQAAAQNWINENEAFYVRFIPAKDIAALAKIAVDTFVARQIPPAPTPAGKKNLDTSEGDQHADQYQPDVDH